MKSIVSYPERGIGGKNSYRGNCSPRMIEDIIQQYKIKNLSDYMVGSGTTEDVCKRMGINGTYLDLNRGFDMMTMDIPDRPQNVFWHPPYGDMIVYSDEQYSADMVKAKFGFDPCVNDLSRCSSWEDFVEKMNYCTMKQFAAMEKGGRMFVLMGDMKRKGKLHSMITDIIKMVVKKDAPLIFGIKYTKDINGDIRDMKGSTWRDVVAAILEAASKPLKLDTIYSMIDGHKKCSNQCRLNKKEKEKTMVEVVKPNNNAYVLSWEDWCSKEALGAMSKK